MLYQKKYAGYIVIEETLADDTKVKDELGRVNVKSGTRTQKPTKRFTLYC